MDIWFGYDKVSMKTPVYIFWWTKALNSLGHTSSGITRSLNISPIFTVFQFSKTPFLNLKMAVTISSHM